MKKMKSTITRIQNAKKVSIMLLTFFCALMINVPAQVIIGWDSGSNGGGPANFGISPWPPATLNSNLSMVGTGLIRGSAISASGSAAGSTWGGSGGWGGTA